jgi:murein L,D-transpeptidase YafK
VITSLFVTNCFAIEKNSNSDISSDKLVKHNDSIKYDKAEQELFNIIDLIQSQKTEAALTKNALLIKRYPNFKLLNAIQSDLLLSKNSNLISPFSSINNNKHQQKYLLETTARLDSISDSTLSHQNHLPASLKYIDSSTQYFFLIDFSKSRLYLFKNNKDSLPKLIADHYVTIGQNGYNKQFRGDKKTPLGIYHITSFLDDKQLPELYGWGAFPINYPNAWDKINKRTGSGIWLHGVPRDTYSRPPLDSKGCLVISNDFLTQIADYLKINTPVILSNSINWTSSDHYKKQSKLFKSLINQWKQAWENKKLKQYLDFYSKSFSSSKKDFLAWAKHKRSIFSNTKKITVKIEQLNVFSYPGEENMLAVSFYQRYKGDNYHSNAYKLQYWKKEKDGKWRITYEYSGR